MQAAKKGAVIYKTPKPAVSEPAVLPSPKLVEQAELSTKPEHLMHAVLPSRRFLAIQYPNISKNLQNKPKVPSWPG